jgi:predicted ATP-grasp superfamily ATP-dependent carboligase
MKTFYVLLLAIMALSVSSCSKRLACPSYYDYGNYSGGTKANEDNSALNQSVKDGRIILYDAYLTIAAKDPEIASAKLEETAKKYNGYVSQSGTYSTTIRVKSDKLKEALAEIELLGKVQSKSISGKDVTDEYMDYEIRLENAEKARLRYLELLEKAENVEAALLCEKELERLNENIETLKGKMNRIDHLVEFSTITVTIKEKKKPGIIGYVGMGLYYSVKWLFVRN